MDEAENKPKKSRLTAVKNRIILYLLILLVGFAVGYYFGYDTGFEKAARILSK